MASAGGGDKYRSFLHGDGEKNTVWRHGGPPNYDMVNKLFEEERTQEWAEGSVEEKVQRLLKTWEMEMVHKVRPEDQKSVHSKNYSAATNGLKPLTRELQRVPGDHAAAGAPHLRPGGGVARVGDVDVPHGVPPGLRHRGAGRVQRPAHSQDRLQVPALGLHGGPLQGPPSARPPRRVLRRLRLPRELF